jgi:hypothetical protein
VCEKLGVATQLLYQQILNRHKRDKLKTLSRSLYYIPTIHTRDIDISTPPLNGNVGMNKCHDRVNVVLSLYAMLKTHALE